MQSNLFDSVGELMMIEDSNLDFKRFLDMHKSYFIGFEEEDLF